MALSARRARQLAAVLRDVRERSRVSAREIARQLRIAHTTVNRWLTGETTPDYDDVVRFLAIIEVVGEEADRILRLARSEAADWLMSGPPGMSPNLASVMECERDATRITVWSPLLIPGLLQTPGYARAVISRSSPDLNDTEIESMVMVRNYRRDTVTRNQNPVELVALVGMPAVIGGVGGTQVMAEQLNHLLDMGRRGNVTIQVADLTGDWSPALVGQFVIYESANVPPTVYLEHHRSGAFVDDKSDVDAFQAAADQIRREAMSPDVTAGLIADVITRTLETTT
jgi:transcriptional regulator with XRE-family HTH domain